jgi:hypothetical protein
MAFSFDASGNGMFASNDVSQFPTSRMGKELSSGKVNYGEKSE